MSTLKLFLFGTPRLKRGTDSIKISRRKGIALLAYLAVTGTAHNRDFLATLFWPEADRTTARGNLRRTLSELSKALGPGNLYSDREIAQLEPDAALWIDVDAFNATVNSMAGSMADLMVEASTTHVNGQIGADALATLQAAVDLYTEDFLAGFTLADTPEFDDWQFFQREEFRNTQYSLLTHLIEHACAVGAYENATHYARQSLALDTLHEPAHRQLMTLYAWADHHAAALRQYEECVRLLDEELGVPPEDETVALYDAILTHQISARNGQADLNQQIHLPALPVDQVVADDWAAAEASMVPDKPDATAILTRLESLPDQRLFGIETAQAKLEMVIQPPDRPWLIAIDGIGGIGKTTLADTLVRNLAKTTRFTDIGWVSAKQEEFLADIGIQETGRPALDVETLTDTLLEQLDEQPHLAASSLEKQAALLRLVKADPYLIVVDNLESVTDYAALVPYMRKLANPSKFLITSRLSLQAYSGIYCYSLAELNETDTLAFLRHESEVRGITRLVKASDEQFREIFLVVGGNPLALKLVMGQIRFLSLTQVLDNLVEAQGKRIDQLYTYIYWQAWQMLDNPSRQLFVTMPMIPNGNFEQMVAISGLNPDDVQSALERLIALSLVQVRGDLEEPRYRLHRLTETFLMNEVLKWQDMAQY